MTQQDIINENIIKQYEIRVQQDIEKIEKLEKELEELRNPPQEEKIYVSTDSPDNVYAAFTDRHRAELDCEDAGVTWCAITLYRGPRKL